MRPKAILSALLCLLLAQAALARNSETTILLRNATLIDRDEGADRTVNILIKNTRLDIITEDLIPIDDADEAYNAEGGVILGQLNLGQPASFMVLNQDPRENFDALLDTKTHVAFAVANGQVVRNRFVMLLQETQQEQRRAEQGWLAYSPPPLAVPLDYQDTGRWNRFDTRYVSGIAVAGLVLDRMNWVDQDSGSLAQVGDLDSFEGGEIRGLRVGGVGTINFDRPWIWTFFGATHAFDKGFDSEDDDSWSIFDARLDIPFWEKASFSIGKQKEPISMETPIGDDEDSHLGDFIEDANIASPVESATGTGLTGTVQGVLSGLTPREAKVLRMRFGIDMNTDHTLEEVGKQFDVTRERIRQIEAKALRKLRHPTRSEQLRSFLDLE